MISYYTLAIGIIALLLVVSGFLSGSETALTAVSRGLMHQLEKEGSRAARDVNALLADREGMIGAILLGNTFINILVSSLATMLFQSTFGARTVVITTIAMTVLILVFAEVLPKTLAIVRTDRFALAVAYSLRIIVSVLAPVVRAVQFFVWRVLALFGVRQTHRTRSDSAATRGHQRNRRTPPHRRHGGTRTSRHDRRHSRSGRTQSGRRNDPPQEHGDDRSR